MPLDILELTALDLGNGLHETLSSLGEVGLTAKETLEVFRERLSRGVRTYIARKNGKVVGTATLLLERKFIHRGGLVAHIEDVATHKDSQGQGVASALLRHVIDEARKLGCYKVVLTCYDRFAPLYAKLGFRTHDVGMRLDLPPNQ
jgi:glucosamine-phosphate N-acetyltransferase